MATLRDTISGEERHASKLTCSNLEFQIFPHTTPGPHPFPGTVKSREMRRGSGNREGKMLEAEGKGQGKEGKSGEKELFRKQN